MRLDRVTVFGGSGFIGRYVVERLADRGASVVVAVRSPEQAKFLKSLGNVGQVAAVRAPIEDAAAVRDAVAGADAVVNLVGILFERGKRTFKSVHVEGARRVAEAAAAAQVPALAHVSSIGADPASRSAYARSKGEGELAVRAAFPKAVILRPSVVFGAEDQFFNRFAALARFLPVLPLYGGGRTRFQPVYVGDVADAVLSALTAEDAAGKTFELAGPRILTLAEVMRLVLDLTGRKRPLMNLPFWLGELQGAVLSLCPTPPLTRDQMILLQSDNVASPSAPGLAALGIAPTPLDAIVARSLERFARRKP